MAPFSVIVFGVVVWTIAVSFEYGLAWTGPNKADTAVHGCHCPGNMAARMRKVLARPWVGVRVYHLLLLLLQLKMIKPQVMKRKHIFLISSNPVLLSQLHPI